MRSSSLYDCDLLEIPSEAVLFRSRFFLNPLLEDMAVPFLEYTELIASPSPPAEHC